MKRPLLILLLCAALAGCGSPGKDPLQVANNATAAKPATVPMSKPPAGTRIPTSAPINETVIAGRTLFASSGSRLLLYDLDDTKAPPRTVPLPGKPGALTVSGQEVLVPVPGAVLAVRADGQGTKTPVRGTPSSAVRAPNGELLAAFPKRNGIAVLRDAKQTAFISGNVSPERLYLVDGKVVALDPTRTALFDVDLAERDFGTGVRAGQGAARAASDQYGRLLVTDARTDALLAFSTGPVLMRQRFPVGKTPFGIAYDPKRALIWVTVTGTNEVTGYSVGRGEPEERYRFPTVGSPDSVAVDPRDGAVYVGSAAQDGLAVVRP